MDLNDVAPVPPYEADGDLIVDLSGVQSMGAATVGVIVHAGDVLRARQQTLTLRSPSPNARRALDVCAVAYAADTELVVEARVTETSGAFAAGRDGA